MNDTLHFGRYEYFNRALGDAEAVRRWLMVANELEIWRRFMGDTPILITGGYRTPERNAQVGGSPTSDHTTGSAVDFAVQGMEIVEVRSRFLRVKEYLHFDQVIFYPSHVHLGVRPDRTNRRKWWDKE